MFKRQEKVYKHLSRQIEKSFCTISIMSTYLCQFCQSWQSTTEYHHCPSREAYLSQLPPWTLHDLICPHGVISQTLYQAYTEYRSILKPPPPRLDASQNETTKPPKKKTKKSRIPKDALEILRDVANSDEKPEESSSETKIDEPENKLETSKKKPKTHFRKSKKPGRA